VGKGERLNMDQDALAKKVRWEGGLWAALEYGIRAEDIADPELATLWAKLERIFSEFAPLVEEATSRLDVAA
jgi:hypothetical protein